MDKRLAKFIKWFEGRNWTPWTFQTDAWQSYLDGKSGLISVATGAGKTYAAYIGPLADCQPNQGLQILYLTPLRALARDLELALKKPIEELNLPLRVESRTGDTKTSQRKKQIQKPPEIMLITPESLSILLSDPDSSKNFNNLKAIIVDEWHELLGNKRGVLLQLAIARLKKWNPNVVIWGLSATLGNLEEAARYCIGPEKTPVLINAHMDREVILESVLPETLDKLPWAGQLGLRMLPYVIQQLDPAKSTLIFTNTRSQAERWHQALQEAKPEWKEIMALHHSSVDREHRSQIESDVKEGILKFIVCTSSLDLGVDFTPVEKIIQIGSPKSIARLMQRAGRSSHRPLTPCGMSLVPTHALEIIEMSAFRNALAEGIVEKRKPLNICYDVLLQHLVSCGIGGFDKEEMYDEIIRTGSYEKLSWEEYESCLQMLVHGGKVLKAYPEFHKLNVEGNFYKVIDKKIALKHRMAIGTITSDPHVSVQFAKGKRLGSIEENFISKLKPGDNFLFGGKNLQLIQFRDLVAYVKLGSNVQTTAAVWQGSRLPFSASLGNLLRKAITHIENGPEKIFLTEMEKIQFNQSAIPQENELLVESLKTREGYHLFFYPFEGRNIHEGISALIAYRLSVLQKGTFIISTNDYGFEILSHHAPIDLQLITNQLFEPGELLRDIRHIINLHEFARSNFRDIARIAGLIFQGYPGSQKSVRQVQVSSSLLYEVFTKYDPENLLLLQAKTEALQEHFEIDRLREVLTRLSKAKIIIKQPKKFTPFALPLFIERVSSHLTSETLSERIEKIKNAWKK